MDTFDKWFSRFMWATDIIFLIASMPHIAAWFAHFDNPGTDLWSNLYAWGVGFGVAFAIDGVSFMLLLAITRMIKQGKTKDGWTMFGLVTFMAIIALLSWGINWQYDIQNASSAFAKADAVNMFGVIRLENLNPIIGGAFPVLILSYALIGKAMQTEVKPLTALTDEQFAQQKKALKQKKELDDLRKGRGIIGTLKDNALELVEAGKEVRKHLGNDDELTEENTEEIAPTSERKPERNTGPLQEESGEENERKVSENPQGNQEETDQETSENLALDPELIPLVTRYPNALQLLTTSASTVSLSDVAIAFDTTPVLLRNRVRNGKLRKTKNPEKVYKDSVISWAKDEMLSRRNRTIINLETARKSQEQSTPDKLQMALEFLKEHGEECSDELLAKHLHLSRPASAITWKHKAIELLRATEAM